jgi:hypothetical protein
VLLALNASTIHVTEEVSTVVKGRRRWRRNRLVAALEWWQGGRVGGVRRVDELAKLFPVGTMKRVTEGAISVQPAELLAGSHG